jgi:hypothetical protein
MRKRAPLVASVLALVVICLLAFAYLWLRAPRYMVNMGWETRVPQAGTYSLSIRYQAPSGPADFVVELEGKSVPFHVERTGGTTTLDLGTWDLKRGGKHVIEVHRDAVVPLLTVESIDLVPAEAPTPR